MRVRKHKVKHYNKIIKRYYLIEDFFRKVQASVHSRVYPNCALNGEVGRYCYDNCKSKYKKKFKESKFKSKYDFENFDSYKFGSYYSVPVIRYNPKKKSRIKNVVTSHLMASLQDINDGLGTSYTEVEMNNIKIVKNLM